MWDHRATQGKIFTISSLENLKCEYQEIMTAKYTSRKLQKEDNPNSVSHISRWFLRHSHNLQPQTKELRWDQSCLLWGWVAVLTLPKSTDRQNKQTKINPRQRKAAEFRLPMNGIMSKVSKNIIKKTMVTKSGCEQRPIKLA